MLNLYLKKAPLAVMGGRRGVGRGKEVGEGLITGQRD